jgi:hypothetical protein
MNMTFGRIAGVRDGGGRTSGYGWLSSYHKINQDYYITGNTGLSFEGNSEHNPIVNDLNIGIHSDNQQIFLGRTLSAAGKLHHDMIDFGAPGGGSDNTPVSYFANGNYTTNVAQRITLPFTQRIAYYVKPYKEFLALGISYAPRIGTYHPENYEFFAGTPIKDEISVSANTEIQIKNLYLGITSGYTQAYRPFNLFSPQGIIKANQYSIFVKEKLSQDNMFKLYELNGGCLEDRQTKDCRAGFQFSKINNHYTRSMGTQIRYEKNTFNPTINTDYFTGWSWSFNRSVRIGLETILRLEERKQGEKKAIKSDFHWLAGIQYQF